MMKLISNGEEFQTETIVKNDTDILGYDSNNNEVFSFKGISDFAGFQLQDENGNSLDFSVPQLTDSERITATEEAINMLITISMM